MYWKIGQRTGFTITSQQGWPTNTVHKIVENGHTCGLEWILSQSESKLKILIHYVWGRRIKERHKHTPMIPCKISLNADITHKIRKPLNSCLIQVGLIFSWHELELVKICSVQAVLSMPGSLLKCYKSHLRTQHSVLPPSLANFMLQNSKKFQHGAKRSLRSPGCTVTDVLSTPT